MRTSTVRMRTSFTTRSDPLLVLSITRPWRGQQSWMIFEWCEFQKPLNWSVDNGIYIYTHIDIFAIDPIVTWVIQLSWRNRTWLFLDSLDLKLHLARKNWGHWRGTGASDGDELFGYFDQTWDPVVNQKHVVNSYRYGQHWTAHDFCRSFSVKQSWSSISN